MKSQVVKVGKAKLAFGLAWFGLGGAAKESAEISKLVNSNKADYLVKIKQKGLPTAVGLMRKQKGVSGTVHSAAALFAHHAKAQGAGVAMLYYRLADNLHAFIAIENGMPMPGYDVVGTEIEARTAAESFMALRPDVQIRLFGNLPFGVDPIAIELATLLRGGTSAAKLTPAKLPLKEIGGVLFFFAALGTAYVQYEDYQKEQAAKAAAAANKQAPKVDPNIAYRQNLPAMLQGAGFRAPETAKAIFALVGSLPIYHAGWTLKEASCAPGGCNTVWEISGGTFESFKKALDKLPKVQKVEYDPNLTTIRASFVMTPPEGASGLKEQALPRKQSFMESLDHFNQVNKGIGLKLARDTKGPAGVLALPPNVQPNEITDPVIVGTWDSVAAHYQRSYITSLPENMTLDFVKIMITPTANTLLCEGKYYVKN